MKHCDVGTKKLRDPSCCFLLFALFDTPPRNFGGRNAHESLPSVCVCARACVFGALKSLVAITHQIVVVFCECWQAGLAVVKFRASGDSQELNGAFCLVFADMMAEEEAVNWNIETEVNLYHAMRNHKPVGVNRHFQMICITKKLHDSMGKRLSAKQIWEHLTKMYDLAALNESETLPFPNKEKDFVLPDVEFLSLKEKGFPRVIVEPAPPPEQNTAIKNALKTPVMSAVPQNVLNGASNVAEDSPKREQRKRTRHTGGASASPASADNTPAKRVRRT